MEEDRAFGEVLGGSRDFPIDGQVGQEGFEIRRAERFGVPLAVEEDEASNPVKIRLLGPETVMPEPNLVADAIEELGRLGVTLSSPVSTRSLFLRSWRCFFAPSLAA
jgi:hypothetical protein